MKRIAARTSKWALIGVAGAAMYLAGCRVTVTAEEPTTAPPALRVVTKTCAPGQYLKGGRHVYRNKRWVWQAPVCVARPTFWKAGCRYIRGHYERHGRAYRWVKGRIWCPGMAPIRVVVRTAPPSILPPARTCPPNTYLRRGRYAWNGVKWTWRPGVCVRRPRTWRASCRYVRGRWQKRGTGFVFNPGRLVCSDGRVVVSKNPTQLPPPPTAVKRCGAGQVLVGAYHKFSAGRWIWNAGRCVTVRRGAWFKPTCRWVRTHWRRVGGRLIRIRGRYICGNRVVYINPTGAIYTPPKRCPAGSILTHRGTCVRRTWTININVKRCPAGMVRHISGRCLPRPTTIGRCAAGMRWNVGLRRCVRVAVARRCAVGSRWNAGLRRCVSIAVPRRCAGSMRWNVGLRRCVPIAIGRRCVGKGVRWDGRLKRCVSIVKPGRCAAGSRWNMGLRRCVRIAIATRCPRGRFWNGRLRRCVARAVNAKCNPGFAMRGGKCVRVLVTGTTCPAGHVKRGDRCVPFRTTAAKCKPGWQRVGKGASAKCVKVVVRTPTRCPAGHVLRGKKCMPRMRGVRRCTPAMRRAGRCR